MNIRWHRIFHGRPIFRHSHSHAVVLTPHAIASLANGAGRRTPTPTHNITKAKETHTNMV